MKHNYQPRLKIYHRTLGKFDLIDKYNNLRPKFYNCTNITISWHFNEFSKTDLNKLIFKEFYFQQRFNYKKTLKRIENLFFKVTLRKKFVFLYLETLLNSYFLKTNIKYQINVNILPTTFILLTMLCQSKFFHYFSSVQGQFSNIKLKNIIKFNYKLNFEQNLVRFNYYFLPFN